MALDLTFNSKDFLNSHLTSGHSNAYTTSTSRGMRGLKITQLASGFFPGTAGRIDWRDKSFEIAGRTQKIKRISSSGGWFSLSRDWKWGAHTYTLKYSRKGWTAKTSMGEVAHYNSYKPHLFRSSDHAAIQISPAIQDQHEIVFLILVMLYSETKRLERKKAGDEVRADALMSGIGGDGGGGGGGDGGGGGGA
ncbi:hypothetical protein C8J57DRAFT_1458668, partial [Mycena rebaudengoi]